MTEYSSLEDTISHKMDEYTLLSAHYRRRHCTGYVPCVKASANGKLGNILILQVVTSPLATGGKVDTIKRPNPTLSSECETSRTLTKFLGYMIEEDTRHGHPTPIS